MQKIKTSPAYSYGFASSELARLRVDYALDELRDFWIEERGSPSDIKDQYPIVLGSFSGKYSGSFEDTAMLWTANEAQTTLTFGFQGVGKTALCFGGIKSQEMSFDQRFGLNTMPQIVLDAWGEIHKGSYLSPQSKPKLLARLKKYEKLFPWYYPVDLTWKSVTLTPALNAERLRGMDLQADYYTGLKAKDWLNLDRQEAKALLRELLSIGEDDSADRMISQGISNLDEDHDSFLDVYEEMIEASEKEKKRRQTASVSTIAHTRLGYLIENKEVEIGQDVDWKSFLDQRLIQVLNYPIRSITERVYRVMFATKLLNDFDAIRMSGSPPFGAYFEEAHKLIQDPNSLLFKLVKDIFQLERKGGRRFMAVMRMPSYAKELIDESDSFLTSRLMKEQAGLLDGFSPDMSLSYKVRELQVVKGDASQWLYCGKGQMPMVFWAGVPLTNMQEAKSNPFERIPQEQVLQARVTL